MTPCTTPHLARGLARMLFGLLVVWFLLLPTALVAGPVRDIDGPAALHRALAQAKGGEVLRLAPGNYGKLELIARQLPFPITYPSPVTLTSADPGNPAVFREVDIREAGNMVFDRLRFEYRFSPGDPIHKRPFSFADSRHLVIRNSIFIGDGARGVSPEEDELGWGIGLSVARSQDAVVEYNEISNFHRGLAMGRARNGLVRGNLLHSLRMDGMVFSRAEGLLIEGNRIGDFRRSTLKRDHADMIQFWTNGATTPTRDIVIRGNLLLAGRGQSTQSIFMRNDMVDRGLAGQEMFYRNITIEENVIVNGHLHGITLGESDGVRIRNNTVLRHPAYAEGENRDRQVRIPRIRLAKPSRDVVIEGNIVAGVTEAEDGWAVRNNLLVQDRSLMQPNHYSRVFQDALAGDPTRLESYGYLPGGPADRPDLGSALLRPGADRPRTGPQGRVRCLRSARRERVSGRAGSAMAGNKRPGEQAGWH